MNNIHLDTLNHSCSVFLPSQTQFELWVSYTMKFYNGPLNKNHQDIELSLLIVDAEEGAEFNKKWRNKNHPTNVLSFPAQLPEGVALSFIGDLIICAPIVEQEAVEQKKLPLAHWAHITIHGVLHLLGYDHMEESEAFEMETLEITILNSLGYKNPY